MVSGKASAAVSANVQFPGINASYRQTELGMIPNDWIVVRLGDVVTFLDGQRRPVKDADRAKMRGSIPYYGASGIVDYINDYLFDEELILLGEDGENILSRNTRLAFRISGRTWVNNHAHVLRPHSNISIGFLTEYLESLNYERFDSGTAQPKLNKQSCVGLALAMPPTKAEQELIAETLADADQLMETLEELIAKRRAAKQGARQELLTGTRRLPGYSGQWEVRSLSEIAECLDNLRVPLNDAQRSKMRGDYPYCGANGVLDYIDRYCTDEPVILIAEDGGHFDEYSIRPIAYRMSGKIWVNNHAHILRAKPGFDQDFLFHSFVHKDIRSFLASGTRAKLNRSELDKITILHPATQDEQADIACILGDMDDQIGALEQKLEKARQIKQGMTQELLTGRVRLV